MRTIGNLLWLILAGVALAIGYVMGGLLMCATIIGIPFGIQSFKLASLALWPFGRTAVSTGSGGCLEVGFNLLWLVLFGWAIFLAHIVAGALLCSHHHRHPLRHRASRSRDSPCGRSGVASCRPTSSSSPCSSGEHRRLVCSPLPS